MIILDKTFEEVIPCIGQYKTHNIVFDPDNQDEDSYFKMGFRKSIGKWRNPPKRDIFIPNDDFFYQILESTYASKDPMAHLNRACDLKAIKELAFNTILYRENDSSRTLFEIFDGSDGYAIRIINPFNSAMEFDLEEKVEFIKENHNLKPDMFHNQGFGLGFLMNHETKIVYENGGNISSIISPNKRSLRLPPPIKDKEIQEKIERIKSGKFSIFSDMVYETLKNLD